MGREDEHMLRRACLIALTLTTWALASPAGAGDITGKWKTEFDTVIGVQKYVFDLKVENGTLSAKAHYDRVGMGLAGDVTMSECKLVGDDISFVEPLDVQGTQVRIVYKGKVSGDEIAFTRWVGDFEPETFTAKRIKE
jgi:hypothetical protein